MHVRLFKPSKSKGVIPAQRSTHLVAEMLWIAALPRVTGL
jgi:hypothetical protein